MRAALRQVKRQLFQARPDPIPAMLGDAALIRIDPARIVLYGETPAERRKDGNKYLHAYYRSRERFILPGRWDLNCGRFRDLERYQAVEELQRYDFDYTKCTRFRELMEQIRGGEVFSYKNKGLVLRSEADVHAYMRGHVDVCKSMRDFGYLLEKANDHICVMIGRDGDLIKEVRGRHRLAIAQVFGVPEVVILIRHVHPIWVRKQMERFGSLPLDRLLKQALEAVEDENRRPRAAVSHAHGGWEL